MMKSFLISGSPTLGKEFDENPGGSDMLSFPGENAIMMVYDGRPLAGRRHVSKLSPRSPTHCGWGVGA
jgi:hypothetical protein